VESNYRFGLPIAASTYADRVDFSLKVLHWGMLAIFVLWSSFFIYCLVRYRQSRQPRADAAGWRGHLVSFLPDGAVLAFEVILIFLLGLPIWSQIKEKFPAEKDAFVLDVTARQFSWGFHYPGPDGKVGARKPALVDVTNPLGLDPADPNATDDVVVFNEIHVPLGKPTLLNMTSQDVIHSFFVPEFRVKQDVVPGLRTPLWFEPTRAGRYEIACAQLCGTSHYVMRADLVVESQAEVDAWLVKMAAGGQAAAAPAPKPAEDWSL
jgi:cytochrome c oxidase subunit 2